MYDALTPLFDQVTDADLLTKFKSEQFGVARTGQGGEAVPRAGVTIVRDRFNVPHITGQLARRRDLGDGLDARRGPRAAARAGRNAARLAAIDAPNIERSGSSPGSSSTRRPSRSTG